MHDVTVVYINVQEGQFIMLKSKDALCEIPLRSKPSNLKVSFTYHKDNSNVQELSANPTNSLLVGRHQDGRNDSTDINAIESFHCAIGPVLSMARLFGLFPMTGIRSVSPSKLRFKIFSFITFYSCFIAAMVFLTTIVSMCHMLKTLNAKTFRTRGGIAEATGGAVFYGNSLMGSILFFRLSLRWVSLQREWRAMERYIDSNSIEPTRLRWKFFFLSTVTLVLSFIEHVLSMFNSVEGYDWNAPNSTFHSFLETYTLRSHSFLFDTCSSLFSVDYNFIIGLYVFVVSKLATFTWNFMDLFIMLVATGLAERYKSLNKTLAVTVTKYRPTFYWRELREDYAILSCIVKKVDEHISPIILLSFANNLYFICLQLLNGLSIPNKNIMSAVYFFGSFGFLIFRTCAVTLLTARIHDQSKEALPYLYNCSTSSYGIEAQRLQYQLATDDVALTGLRFFSITRNFMLAVAGAIITYEVVLLQFNGVK
ncbi:gustatory receptor 5a for trehalose-like isoform X1 [Frieseomelitta varia]|uniref:gustatory receptor 5a for trehalose-like isoform X1 n=1 Tax=Frieseomelitta varia TaxID=561572 RepID=UPI001CB6AEDF|nr:gustatory receptor 5a for trehalose-like isoform X1 [Frieseomelitta varia]